MKTIDIYRNYRVLQYEKRNIYTYGGQHPYATCSDRLTVAIPQGWELYETLSGDLSVTAPWGSNYEINDVLSGDKYPYFRAYDKDMNLRVFQLEEVK